MLWRLDMGSTVCALNGAPGVVFAGVGDDRRELYIVDAAMGAVLSTVDLEGSSNPVALVWDGPGVLRVVTKKSPGPEVTLVDVSNPRAPNVMEEIETGEQTVEPRSKMV